MIIRCTQKLLAELKACSEPHEPVTDSFMNCHATLFRIQRHKCVMISNDLTLFTIFIPFLRKPEFEFFHLVVGQHFFKNLIHENIPQPQIEAVLSEFQNVGYQKTCNRRVLGSMNDLRRGVEYRIYEAGGLERINLYELNAELNRTFLGVINHKYPIKIFREMLTSIG
ncbi:MAG: DUF6933 domain-containing protein [Desulfomonilaceae bacterium]